MRYRVSTPVAGHAGQVGGIHFADGKALVDDETHAAELAYCRAAGYTVEPVDDDGEPVEVDEDGEPDDAAMPKKSAKTEVWRAWAVKHGGMPPEEADAKSRDELVAHYTIQENES